VTLAWTAIELHCGHKLLEEGQPRTWERRLRHVESAFCEPCRRFRKILKIRWAAEAELRSRFPA
jgi:hypothetical protein